MRHHNMGISAGHGPVADRAKGDLHLLDSFGTDRGHEPNHPDSQHDHRCGQGRYVSRGDPLAQEITQIVNAAPRLSGGFQERANLADIDDDACGRSDAGHEG